MVPLRVKWIHYKSFLRVSISLLHVLEENIYVRVCKCFSTFSLCHKSHLVHLAYHLVAQSNIHCKSRNLDFSPQTFIFSFILKHIELYSQWSRSLDGWIFHVKFNMKGGLVKSRPALFSSKHLTYHLSNKYWPDFGECYMVIDFHFYHRCFCHSKNWRYFQASLNSLNTFSSIDWSLPLLILETHVFANGKFLWLLWVNF